MGLPVFAPVVVMSAAIALALASSSWHDVPAPSRTIDAPRIAALLFPARTIAHNGDACPLTPAEEQDAVEKFDKLWPVLRHPRCLNCHGVVNPYIDERRGKHAGGRIERDLDDMEFNIRKCQECHILRRWDTPADFFFFTGRSARQLCMQFKESEATPTMFVQHAYNDRGGTPFIEEAFKGERNLNEAGKIIAEDATGRPFVAEKPPMSHGEFVQLASDWANAIGERGWKATRDCGCGRKKKSWTGTITGVWQFDMERLGHVTETANTNVRFEIDSSYAPGPDTYWKSVSGEIEWSTVTSGAECQASASGTVPIGLGGDDNPMATLTLQTQLGGGPRYMVAIGPWRDEHQPRFVIRCQGSPPIGGLLWGAGHWWGHETPGMVSLDGKTLQGSYQSEIAGMGTVIWTWDLQLDEGEEAADNSGR